MLLDNSMIQFLSVDLPWGESEIDLSEENSEGDPVLMDHANCHAVVRHLEQQTMMVTFYKAAVSAYTRRSWRFTPLLHLVLAAANSAPINHLFYY